MHRQFFHASCSKEIFRNSLHCLFYTCMELRYMWQRHVTHAGVCGTCITLWHKQKKMTTAICLNVPSTNDSEL